MKRLIPIVLISLVNVIYAQETSIDSLIKLKSEIENEVRNLNSILKTKEEKLREINQEIDFIQSKAKFEKISETSYVEAEIIASGSIRETPEVSGKVIAQLFKGDNVRIVDKINDDYEVLWGNETAFIRTVFINSKEVNEFIKLKENEKARQKILAEKEKARIIELERIRQDSIKRVEEQKIKEENERIRAEKQKQEAIAREKYKREIIAKYGKEIGQKLLDGFIWLGMTDDMARISFGPTEDINRTVFSGGTHEQWIYGNNVYLYFENGILTSWQE